MWQGGIGWGHDPTNRHTCTCPTSIRLPTESCCQNGPEELTSFLLKHSSFVRIPHERMRKEK